MTKTDTNTRTERIHADHTVTKRLGNWTRAPRFEIRARGGLAVLDLRSPDLPADVEIRLDLHRSTVKLLVPDDATVDHWDLSWTGKGKVKDAQGLSAVPSGVPSGTANRRIRLVGSAANSEIRVHRGGVAIVSAMLSRAYLQDLRHAHKTGGVPTVDDPGRTA
jgi:hypothetical protein